MMIAFPGDLPSRPECRRGDHELSMVKQSRSMKRWEQNAGLPEKSGGADVVCGSP